jgi:hypothetical protein
MNRADKLKLPKSIKVKAGKKQALELENALPLLIERILHDA